MPEEDRPNHHILEGAGWRIKQRPAGRVGQDSRVHHDLGYLPPGHPGAWSVSAVGIPCKEAAVLACLDVAVEGRARRYINEVRSARSVDREAEAEHHYLGQLASGGVIARLEADITGC